MTYKKSAEKKNSAQNKQSTKGTVTKGSKSKNVSRRRHAEDDGVFPEDADFVFNDDVLLNDRHDNDEDDD